MIHKYLNKNSDHTLIMLHGTGGNEEEMALFGQRINLDFNILSIRGNVNEHGMNRFFKRYGMGQYDLENYVFEVGNLKDSIKKYSELYKFDLNKSFVIGFSNGANIALGLIQEYPSLLNNYILLSPDHINKDKGFQNLSNIDILMSSSKNDPYTPFDHINILINELTKNGAKVKNYLVSGHVITTGLLEEVKSYVKVKAA